MFRHGATNDVACKDSGHYFVCDIFCRTLWQH